MKKLLLVLLVLITTIGHTKADSYFLSGLEFNYLYEKVEVLNNIQKNGLESEQFAIYLLDPDTNLGKKTAIVVALASYAEFNLYDSGEDVKYFEERASYFRDIVTELYGSKSNFPVEIDFLLQLMREYNSMDPEVDAYIDFANKMPESLTVQSVKVIAMAYDIVYNDKRDFATRKRYRDEFLNPYMAEKDNYEQDINPNVYTKITGWEQYVDDCSDKKDGEELTCICAINSKKDLLKCLNEVNEATISRIKNAKVKDNVEDIAQSELLKTTIINGINLEKDYIATLKTSDLNKSALLYYYLNNVYVFCVDLQGFHRIIRGGYIFNRDTKYIRQFVWDLNIKECNSYNVESRRYDNPDFYESECYKLYMQKLDKELNNQYKALGGPSNLKLKKAQLAWLKMRDLHAKRKGNDFVTSPGQDQLLEQNILENRVSAYDFYQAPDKIMEILSSIDIE